MSLRIVVNGREHLVEEGLTVAALVEAMAASPRGLAVARNGEVVTRSSWGMCVLAEDDHVELLSAAPGG